MLCPRGVRSLLDNSKGVVDWDSRCVLGNAYERAKLGTYEADNLTFRRGTLAGKNLEMGHTRATEQTPELV